MRKKTWLPAVILVLVLLLTACTGGGTSTGDRDTGTEGDTSAPETTESVTDNGTENDGATEAPTDPATEAPTETPTETPAETDPPEEVKEPIMKYSEMSDLEKLTTPFWLLDVMDNEATTFIVREDGTITAKLLFKPTRILSVKSNDLKTTYTEGVDYAWDGESNTLTWLDGSAIPYFTQNDIHGKDADGNYIPDFGSATPWDELGRSRFNDALYCVSAFLYEKQIAVTYEYAYGSWDGPVTEYQGDRLPKTMEKLANGESINVVFYGDSIFTGCDSSAMYNREPMQESFPTLIKQVLESKYPNLHVKRYNPSVGGMNSVWGVENVSLVTDKEPDLVFIGFGMNDGGTSGRAVARNIQRIMTGIREQYPDCEFVVVVPMVPNNDAGFLSTHTQFPEAYAALAGEGVAYVDMFSFHEKLLEQKDFISMSGNNINHPNDWLIRVYTMNLLSALLLY